MDDAALVREFRRTGNAAFFERLVERHRDRTFHIAASVLAPGHRGEAEEITQDALLVAFQRLSTLLDPGRFGPWLFRIAYRKAIDRKKTARHRWPHLSDTQVELRSGSGVSPPDNMAARRRLEQVEACLERLPDLYRTVLHLRYWMDLSVNEIAEQLRAPSGTIKSYLFRARKRLHGLLEAEGLDYE